MITPYYSAIVKEMILMQKNGYVINVIHNIHLLFLHSIALIVIKIYAGDA
jgi:hypothetical protein